MKTMTLDRPALEAILAHARETHPAECCGAVVAAGGRDQLRRFTNIQGRLHQESPTDFPRDATTAYTPEPRELLDAIRAGEQPGASLKLFYHSHSKNGAYFSGEDRARAMFDGDPAYPEVTYLVVSDAREPGEARAFRWDDATHDFAEVTLEVTGAAAVQRAATAKKPRAAKPRARPARKGKPSKGRKPVTKKAKSPAPSKDKRAGKKTAKRSAKKTAKRPATKIQRARPKRPRAKPRTGRGR